MYISSVFSHIQDQVVQERLVEKYMQLPNQIWENIIAKASQVCSCIYCNY